MIQPPTKRRRTQPKAPSSDDEDGDEADENDDSEEVELPKTAKVPAKRPPTMAEALLAHAERPSAAVEKERTKQLKIQLQIAKENRKAAELAAQNNNL